MEYPRRLLLRHRPRAVDLVEELAVSAVLHEDEDLALPPDHLVDLRDILVQQALLGLDLSLDSFCLLLIVLLHSHDLHGHRLPGGAVGCLPHLPEPPLTDRLLYFMPAVLNS